MPLMLKSEYAALKGWSKSYLSKKTVREKLQPAMVEGEDGIIRIDSDIADAIFAATRDPARAHLRKTTDQIEADQPALVQGYEKSRAEREAIKVEEARLDLLERKGKTLDRAQVYQAYTASSQIIVEHLKAAGRRVAEKAATMTDARAIKSMIDDEIRSALEVASHEFERRAADKSGDDRVIN